MEKIIIPLDNGYKLVTERNGGSYDKEIYVGIESPNGAYIQDLTTVRPSYRTNGNDVIFNSDQFEVLVYSDNTIDDYTHKFDINLTKDEEE